MGLTIAVSLNVLNPKEASSGKNRPSKNKQSEHQIGASSIVVVFLAALIGFILGVLPLQASASQRSAIASGKTDAVIAAAYEKPLDPSRMNVLAAVLANYGYPDEALTLSKKTVEIFPLSYDAWRIISQLEVASLADKANALQKMRQLDPLNESIGK
jgi:hypothetical protein